MSRLRPLEGVQSRLFTDHGQLYSDEAEDRELRVDIYEHLATVFGGVEIPTEVATCPRCGGRIKALPHRHGAAYCPDRRCGWHLPRLVGREESA